MKKAQRQFEAENNHRKQITSIQDSFDAVMNKLDSAGFQEMIRLGIIVPTNVEYQV